jgi:hypothetical protein
VKNEEQGVTIPALNKGATAKTPPPEATEVTAESESQVESDEALAKSALFTDAEADEEVGVSDSDGEEDDDVVVLIVE